MNLRCPHRTRQFVSPGLVRTPLSVLALVSMAGCMHMTKTVLPDRESGDVSTQAPALTMTPSTSTSSAGDSSADGMPSERLFKTPAMVDPGRLATRSNAAGGQPLETAIESSVSLEQLPLPVFIETVYVSILKRNVSMDPSIAQRKELVSLKSGKPMSAAELASTAKAVLRSYGLAVTEFENLVRVMPQGGTGGYLPELQRGRALPDVPSSLRPIFYLAELDNVSPSSITSWLRTLFGQRVTITDDMQRQAVLLTGQTDDVSAALEAIQVLDQPLMRGRISARISPLFWSADELAKRLGDVLTAQGYSVGQSAGAQAPIILLPIGPLNSVIAFAASEATLNHALRWATELDQPANGRGSAGYFTYAVRNMDAGELAKTLQEVMTPAGGGQAAKSRVVVNPASNTLIIQGSPTEYQQWFGLLQELDRPARTALVSVTVAEVRLNNTEQMGFEWLLRQFTLGDFNVNLRNSLGVGNTSNLVATFTSRSSSTNALLNVLASTGRARVLANPSVLARNGEPASLQVGQDVPIITQQQQGTVASGVPGGILQNNSVLQSIQYRNTGIILKVKPVIHAGGRVDLDIEQEVSSVQRTTVGVTSTPTIQSRKLSTKLSVADGTTVLLGGLMREDNTRDDSGVPLLKDIPVLGHLFKQSTDTRERTELVVLVTPYVINDEFEARAISDAFRNQFSWDSSLPMHKLRTPQLDAPQRAPAATPGLRQQAAEPYVVPPVGQEDARSQGPARSGPLTERRPGTPAPSDASKPSQEQDSTSTNLPKPRAPVPTEQRKPAPTENGNAQGAGVGKPVDDPQILKELMDAVNRKR